MEAFLEDHALLLDVNFDSLLKRLTGRRTCKVCGHLYNIHFSPPKKQGVCDVDGGELVQRHAARAVVVDLQPALFHDAAAARIELVQRLGDAGRGHGVALAALQFRGGFVGRVGQDAQRFARTMGFTIEDDLNTETSRRAR